MKNKNVMSGLMTALLSAAVIMLSAGAAPAAEHYFPGVLGIQAATMPPPGFHYQGYNVFYYADSIVDNNGDERNIGFDLGVYALSNQFVYMTNYKILGADFGMDTIIPFINTNIEIKAAGIDDQQFGLGDIVLEPFVLGWHGARYDAVLSLAAIAPTGDSGEAASPGKGYWSAMETLGATVYFDEARTWSASLLTRWLQNGEDRDTNITNGMDLVAEYGVAKAIPVNSNFVFTAGLVGYSDLQLTDDDGPGADPDVRRRVNGVGPEVRFMIFQPYVLQLSLRYNVEYGAQSTTEGQNFCLTVVASF